MFAVTYKKRLQLNHVKKNILQLLSNIITLSLSPQCLWRSTCSTYLRSVSSTPGLKPMKRFSVRENENLLDFYVCLHLRAHISPFISILSMTEKKCLIFYGTVKESEGTKMCGNLKFIISFLC